MLDFIAFGYTFYFLEGFNNCGIVYSIGILNCIVLLVLRSRGTTVPETTVIYSLCPRYISASEQVISRLPSNPDLLLIPYIVLDTFLYSDLLLGPSYHPGYIQPAACSSAIYLSLSAHPAQSREWHVLSPYSWAV